MVDNFAFNASKFGVTLSDSAINQFQQYFDLLVEKNKVMNLTAITDINDVYSLHFLDSLSLFQHFDFVNKSVIDIGSGAGFPGLPVKIAESKVNLTMLDAQQKRINFLCDVCNNICITNVDCIHARAEEVAFDFAYRDSFDFALSRAVARLNILCELCMPFVKKNGYFIAMKSVESDDEIMEAENAISVLGGMLDFIYDYLIPETDVTHRIVAIKKLHDTPTGYPRRFSKINKSPIR